MGRVETDAPQHPPPETIDDAPPLDEDLYEPPSDYQPPPQAFPPPQPAAATSFPPPPEDYVNAQAFTPPQEHHHAADFPPPQEHHPAAAFPPAQSFPPQDYQKPQHFNQQPFPNQYMQQQQNMAGIPLGYAAASPLQIQFQTQPWKTSLFDCMDNPQNAMITLLFPCVTFGQIAEIIDSGTTTCGTSGLLYSMIAFCIAMPCLMSCSYRSKLRSKYGLVESPAPDWVVHCFCECCALCQEYRELQQRGFDPTIGWMGNVAQQQTQQYGMTPPMQQRMM